MKNIINKLNLNCKQFSELYEIPYMTVNQWYNGKRTPPKWVIKLFNELIESKKKGEQTEMPKQKIMYTVHVKTEINEWREFYSENDVVKAYMEKDFWKNQIQTKEVELECWEKIY